MKTDSFPSRVRFIKLGASGAWATRAFSENVVFFGAHGVSHDHCLNQNWDDVEKQVEAITSSKQNRSEGLRQLKDFYDSEPTLWVTLANGHVWWTISDGDPELLNQTEPNGPSHLRRCKIPWSNESIDGRVLIARSMSSRLTKTFSYQRTICAVGAQDYLLRLIRNERDPLQVEAERVLAQQIDIVQRLIERLHWAEFENLVDLIFSRNGWRRTTVLGRSVPDIDLVAAEPVSGRTAWVQIKAQANQRTLEDYYERFQSDGTCTDFYFVCHSSNAEISLPPNASIHIWKGKLIAEQAIEAGLLRWLVDHV